MQNNIEIVINGYTDDPNIEAWFVIVSPNGTYYNNPVSSDNPRRIRS